MLESALNLAKMGFHVFPIGANSKVAAIKDFPNVATTNQDQIKSWWADRPYCNVGISTSSFNGGDSALLVVDVDNKGTKKGDDEIIKLEIQGKEFSPTLTQRTPTGGRHLIYRVKHPVKQSANAIAAGIDTRSKGGYIVGAGSKLDGGVYTFESDGINKIAEAPEWLIQCFNVSKTKEVVKSKASTPNISQVRAIKRAKEYLESAPLSIEGSGGDQVAFIVAAKLKDFGLSKVDALALMLEDWNEKCSPPWNNTELKLKVENAYRYGEKQIGSDAPETVFKPIANDGNKPKFYLDEINASYALVYMEGSHFILHETVDEKGRKKHVFLNEASFKRKFSPLIIQEGKGKAKTYAENWLDWSGRREYAGVCFSPEKDPRNGYYNLWKGFSVDPIPYFDAEDDARRGFDMFMEHIEKNVCQGDTLLKDWLMGYFAHMVQKPYERPLTTLVFKGLKGTGKNAPIDRIGKLLGSGHYLVAHDGRYLTSNFNGHLDSCLCLVLDEAFWSGDKSAEGKLKGITTAPEIIIERKGKEPYAVDNLVRLIVIGNEDWLVPASADERRYAVFQVGEGRMQDNRFFEDMRILMDEKGGNAILLDFLKKYDLSKTSVNVAPNTAALYEQKTASQDALSSWWYGCLSEGRIFGVDFGNDWPKQVDKEALRQAYLRYSKERGITKWMPDAISFGKRLRKVCKGIQFTQKRREGEALISVYRLPTLEEARDLWDTAMNFKNIWDQNE